MAERRMVPLHVLLVEDSEHDWLAFRRAIQDCEMPLAVTRCVRAEEALERLGADESAFDLVVTDYKLPGMSGLDLCRALIARQYSLPIVLLTGAGTENLAVEALKAGVDDYLIKDMERGYLELLPVVLPDVVRKHGDRLARQCAEEALRKSEARYRAIVEDQTELVCRFRPDGTLTFVNEAYSRYFGKAVEELLGYDFWQFVFEEDRAVVMEQIALLSRENPVATLEHRVLPPESELRWHQWTIRALFDGMGHPVDMQAVGRDVTERMRAEQSLRQRNRELALLNRSGRELVATLELGQVAAQLLQDVKEIVDVGGASVWFWEGEEHEWLVCSAASEQDEGQPPVGLRVRAGQGVVGWTAETGQSAIVPSVRDDRRFFAGIDQQTGFRTVSLLAVPLRARGRVIGVLEAVNKRRGDFDEGDRALLETLAATAAVAIDNARLVETLRQHTRTLEARNEELDAFAHTVAHDLKNPLGLIIGYSEMLESLEAGASDEQAQQSLRAVRRSAMRMDRIIEELLLLAGVRKMEVEPIPLRMGAIVAEACQRLSYMIEQYQVEITVPDGWPAARGYGPWIEEVWANYLSNAIKYGGVPPQIEIGATVQPDGTVQFWVRDNGAGLTPEEQSRLFKPFTRLEEVRAKGHGLGLSVVRRIVEKLGGEVGLESAAGEGSLFWFSLPAA